MIFFKKLSIHESQENVNSRFQGIIDQSFIGFLISPWRCKKRNNLSRTKSKKKYKIDAEKLDILVNLLQRAWVDLAGIFHFNML